MILGNTLCSPPEPHPLVDHLVEFITCSERNELKLSDVIKHLRFVGAIGKSQGYQWGVRVAIEQTLHDQGYERQGNVYVREEKQDK